MVLRIEWQVASKLTVKDIKSFFMQQGSINKAITCDNLEGREYN